MNFFNFLQLFNPFNFWNQMFPTLPPPLVLVADPEIEPEDPQDFDLEEEDAE